MGGSCRKITDQDEPVAVFTKVTKRLPVDKSMRISHITAGYFFSAVVYNRNILYSGCEEGNSVYNTL
jgi:hypothetical protein